MIYHTIPPSTIHTPHPRLSPPPTPLIILFQQNGIYKSYTIQQSGYNSFRAEQIMNIDAQRTNTILCRAERLVTWQL